MTQRERVLAFCVAGAIGGLALASAVRWGVVDPLRDMGRRIKTEADKRDGLRTELAALDRVEKEWQAQTARTLATDPERALLIFRENLMGLLERHGLADDPKSMDASVSRGPFRSEKNGFVTVPVNISTTGTLKQVVGFLCDFYRQDYFARLEHVALSADSSVYSGLAASGPAGKKPPARGSRRSTSRRRDKSIGPDGPELTVKITATTLVLPQVQKIEPTPLEEIEELPMGRLLGEDLVAYNDVFDKNLFKPYQPKPVVEPEPPKPAVAVKPPDPKPKPKPTPPPENLRKDADKFYVRLTGTLNGEPIAYVYDERRREDPPQILYHDDDIDADGTLLLIHISGLVVRVTEQNGHEKDYVYPLGKSFADRVELTPDAYPEVWAALQEEFVPSVP